MRAQLFGSCDGNKLYFTCTHISDNSPEFTPLAFGAIGVTSELRSFGRRLFGIAPTGHFAC